MATNYDINYEDERFTQVQADKQQALTDVENTYSGMIGETDKYYQAQIDASKEWASTQQQLQQDNTDFAIEQIEQQKAQANKDYTKEQAGAYVDWQKQSNDYGVNAEQMAASGLVNTGFSESSQVSMYNAYQNRVTVARESYNKAVLNYNNAIKEAQLQNNSALAEIAYNALQKELELSLQGFQYKNQLIIEQANKKQEVDNTYYGRYQDVLNQMNQENALAEEVRQYNESLQLQKQQLQEEIRQYEQSYALQVKQYEESIRQFDAEMARLKAKDKKEYALEIQRLELQKQQAQAEQSQWEKEYQLAMREFDEKQRQFNASLAAANSNRIANPDKISDPGESTEDNYTSFGNSKTVAARDDYYFDNGYQPRYVNNVKLRSSGLTVGLIFGNKFIVPANQNVWKAGNKFFVWDGDSKNYIDVTTQVKANTGKLSDYEKMKMLR